VGILVALRLTYNFWTESWTRLTSKRSWIYRNTRGENRPQGLAGSTRNSCELDSCEIMCTCIAVAGVKHKRDKVNLYLVGDGWFPASQRRFLVISIHYKMSTSHWRLPLLNQHSRTVMESRMMSNIRSCTRSSLLAAALGLLICSCAAGRGSYT
jgi:hypothetical protein